MTPYETLNVGPGSTQDEIRRAYRRLASIHHPDKGGDPIKFNEIQKAYDQLSDRKPTKGCPMCGNKGFIKKRYGAFVKNENCPLCWS